MFLTYLNWWVTKQILRVFVQTLLVPGGQLHSAGVRNRFRCPHCLNITLGTIVRHPQVLNRERPSKECQCTLFRAACAITNTCSCTVSQYIFHWSISLVFETILYNCMVPHFLCVTIRGHFIFLYIKPWHWVRRNKLKTFIVTNLTNLLVSDLYKSCW